MSKIIVFTNIKGGVGTTTISIATAKILSKRGKKVLYVDGDRLAQRGIILCCMGSLPVYTLADWEEGKCRAKQAVWTGDDINFNALSCYNLKGDTTPAIQLLDGLFDYVICDNVSLDNAYMRIVVTEPYTPSLKCSDVCITNLKAINKENVYLCLNKVSPACLSSGDIPSPQDVSRLLSTPLIATIREDLSIPLGSVKNGAKSDLEHLALSVDREIVKPNKMPYCGYFKRRARNKL